uniref:Uncharacterized protein n=1 Tax=Glossina pallidipes TaxID=7398 RepID=A0A1A9ZQQ2_GLOPL
MNSSHSWVTAMRTACNLSLAEVFSCACFVQISSITVDNGDDEKVVRLLFSTLSDPLVMLAKLLSTELLRAFKCTLGKIHNSQSTGTNPMLLKGEGDLPKFFVDFASSCQRDRLKD